MARDAARIEAALAMVGYERGTLDAMVERSERSTQPRDEATRMMRDAALAIQRKTVRRAVACYVRVAREALQRAGACSVALGEWATLATSSRSGLIGLDDAELAAL